MDCFDELVPRLYDAAAEPALCWDLLADLANRVDAFGAQFLLWDGANNGPQFTAYTGYGPEAEALYGAYYGGIDPRRITFESRPAGQLSLCHEQFDESFVRESEFYNDFLIPQGGRFMMSAKLAADNDVSALLSFHRNDRQGCFGPEELRKFQRLIPHAMRAASLGLRISQLQMQGQRLEAAIDRVDWGIIVTDAAGKVILANAEAEAHLRAGDGLTTVKNRLGAWRLRDDEHLLAVIRRTAEGASGDTVGGALKIERSSGQRPLNVLAAPLTNRNNAKTGFQRPLVILFISNPERESPSLASVLQSLYGLTAAEANVATNLADGLSLDEIAEARGRSLNTVRSQLKSLMAKMDVSRQAELVRQILKMARPR